MKIGQLSQATGVDVETIRFYARSGLLDEPARQANGYRAYDERHLQQLAFIRHCRALDIPLAQVRLLLDFAATPGADCTGVNAVIDTQLARVRARLASLRALQRQLVTLRGQCHAGGQAGDCGILHELVAAAHSEACACHPPA